jgi:hypothetical protein
MHAITPVLHEQLVIESAPKNDEARGYGGQFLVRGLLLGRACAAVALCLGHSS